MMAPRYTVRAQVIDIRTDPPQSTAAFMVDTNAWAKIKRQSLPLVLTLDDPSTDAALVRFATQPVDGLDLFLLEGMFAASVKQVLTDDGDYCTVPGLQVFTANQRVVAAARAAG